MIALAVAAAMVAGLAAAAPTIYGTSGLIRVMSARNTGPMTFGVGFHGLAWMKDSTEFHRYSDRNVELYPEGYFAINDMFELSVAPKYNYYRMDPWSTAGGYRNGLFDTKLGLKVSYRASDAIWLAFYGGYDIPTQGLNDTLLKPKHYWDSLYQHTGIVHARVLSDFCFGPAKLHVNLGVGYKLDKQDDSTAVYPNVGFPYGIGVSYETEWVTPYLEFTGKGGIDSTTYYKITGAATVEKGYKRGILNNVTSITPGVRVTFPFGMNLDLAFDYNIMSPDTIFPMWVSPVDLTSDAVPPATKAYIINMARGMAGSQAAIDLFKQYDWQIVAGLSYAPKTEKGPKVPATGIIAGKVTDSKGKPLAATITVAGMTFNADPATGNYTAPGIQITGTPVEVKADLKGYIAKTGSVLLTKKNKKTPAVQDFALELKPDPMGTVKGVVTDAATGASLEGTVAFGAASFAIKGGIYGGTLKAGAHSGVVRVPGYFEKTVAVTVADKGTVMGDARLVKRGAPMDAAVAWKLASNALVKSFDGRNIVAAANEAPSAAVVVTAYVDRVGGAKVNQKLADSRANAVKAELVKAGIFGDRITAKGVVVTPAGKTVAARTANTKVVVTLE